MTKTVAEKYIEQKADELKELSLKIWEHPEVAYEEVQASKWTADYLEANGFEVEREYAGVPTAIKASWGKGKPVIGLLGEYDALPGMSQKVKADKDPIKKGAPGQACGHNMLGVAHVGAALGIKKELEENNLEGTVIFYGCPAEEVLTGKVFMARNGAFRELDLSLAFHPGTENRLTTGRMVAMNSVKFHFHGVTAHAGGDPHNGRSALDGVELLNVSANYLREHVTDDVRIHYSITNGGPAPNIVPDYASVWYFVRALTRETVDDTYNRLVKAAKGAAMATETEVEIEFLGGCYNTLQNKELVNLVHDTMKDTELPSYTDEELEFAQKMNLTSPKYKQMLAEGKAKEDIPIANYISPIAENNGFGSTDVGDVQHIAPGVMFTTATHNIAAPGHSWQITASSGSSYGQKGMLYASKVMAKAAMKAIKDPSIIEKAKEEFNEVMGNKEYECPIPKDVPIPGKEN
jgi:aminobenzoyl-glutamate utilization protein B